MIRRVLGYLFPTGLPWRAFVGSQFDALLNGIAGFLENVRTTLSNIFYDLSPATTTLLGRWLTQWGIFNPPPAEADQRALLASYWLTGGNQSPQQIQDTLQAAGFDVYVYDWWTLPKTEPPIVINPNFYIEGGTGDSLLMLCGVPGVTCGGPGVTCGAFAATPRDGYLLKNNTVESFPEYAWAMGGGVSFGNADATFGDARGLRFFKPTIAIPTDPTDWRGICYIASATFPTRATVSAARRGEFETLLLKICPANVWLGVLVEYV